MRGRGGAAALVWFASPNQKVSGTLRSLPLFQGGECHSHSFKPQIKPCSARPLTSRGILPRRKLPEPRVLEPLGSLDKRFVARE